MNVYHWFRPNYQEIDKQLRQLFESLNYSNDVTGLYKSLDKWVKTGLQDKWKSLGNPGTFEEALPQLANTGNCKACVRAFANEVIVPKLPTNP